jgi:Flp pilus assembly protein TadD
MRKGLWSGGAVLACAIVVRGILIGMIAAGAAAGAQAMDNTVTEGGPDLTAVRALIKAEKFADAIRELKKLEAKGPKADVFNLLAFSQHKSGDFSTAYENYQKALKLEPEHRGAHDYLGELFI